MNKTLRGKSTKLVIQNLSSPRKRLKMRHRWQLYILLLFGGLFFAFQYRVSSGYTKNHNLVDIHLQAILHRRESDDEFLEEQRTRVSRTLPATFEKFANEFKTSHLKATADVEGANMDHNGSISNPCLTERSLLRRALFEEPPKAFEDFGLSPFILVNAYRINGYSFVAVGLSALTLHDSISVEKCFWMGHDGTVLTGKLYPLYPGEHHDLMYEAVIVQCSLEKETSSGEGGNLLFTIDKNTFEVYSEDHPLPQLSPGPDFKYNIGFCSFPIYRDIVTERISEWIQYSHLQLGVEFFVLNDGGSIDEEAYKILEVFVKKGILEINDIRGAYRYESKHNVLVLNDCIYKMRWISKWSLVLDFDEYLYIRPPTTLPSLLARYEDKPWLTFGSLWWSVDLCRAKEEKHQWPLEQMGFHWPEFYCVNQDLGYTQENCLNYHGHRKYIINTNKVSAVEVHRPIAPIDGGINVKTSEAWINHFQGIIRPSVALCQEMIQVGKYPEWWVEDDYLALKVKDTRMLSRKMNQWFS